MHSRAELYGFSSAGIKPATTDTLKDHNSLCFLFYLQRPYPSIFRHSKKSVPDEYGRVQFHRKIKTGHAFPASIFVDKDSPLVSIQQNHVRFFIVQQQRVVVSGDFYGRGHQPAAQSIKGRIAERT